MIVKGTEPYKVIINNSTYYSHESSTSTKEQYEVQLKHTTPGNLAI